MTSSSITQCFTIFLTKTIQLAQLRRGDRFQKSAKRTGGINEVLTTDSPPALMPIGVSKA